MLVSGNIGEHRPFDPKEKQSLALYHHFFRPTVDGRNPKQQPGMVLKPVVNDGISTANLNWLFRRILEPSTVLYWNLRVAGITIIFGNNSL